MNTFATDSKSARNPFDDFSVDHRKLLTLESGLVPLIFWTVAPNFGDLLSPWLFDNMTGMRAELHNGKGPAYCAIGSILKKAKDESVVWGSGAFGVESRGELAIGADYRAVRGPLSRSLLKSYGIECPRVYGDPALLTPYFYDAPVKKSKKTGLAVRWSDKKWKNLDASEDVEIIDFMTEDVEGTLDALLRCEKIVTSSLHGLIIADAFGIPSAWISSETPKGREFKFYDYFLSVEKVRHSQDWFATKGEVIDEAYIERTLSFDDRDISFDPYALLEACPFLDRYETQAK